MSQPALGEATTEDSTRRQLEQDPRWQELPEAMREHVLAASVEVSMLPDLVVRHRLVYFARIRGASRVMVNLLTYHDQERNRLLSAIEYDNPKVRKQMRGELAIIETRAAYGRSLPPDQKPAAIFDNDATMHKLYVAGTLARDAVLGVLGDTDSAGKAE